MVRREVFALVLAFLVWSGMEQVQAQDTAAQVAPGPRLIQYNSVLKDDAGQPLAGVQGIMVALYKDQQGGSALWVETQNVTADEQGRFTVFLGSATSGGVPLNLFSSGESRWLGIQAQAPGAVEQPRVLLVGVPYALKAADAETLGGKPLSSFVLTTPEEQATSPDGGTAVTQSAPGITPRKVFYKPKDANLGGTSVTNSLTKWSNTTGNITNSAAYDVSGNIGIGTTGPASKLDIENASASNDATTEIYRFGGGADGTLGPTAMTFSAHTSATGSNRYILLNIGDNLANRPLAIQAGVNVGIGTTSPSAQMHVQTSADASKGLIVEAYSSTQSADLQEWQDNSGNSLASVNPAGAFVGPLGMMLTHASFVQASGSDAGSATFIPSDSLMEAQTGTTNSSMDDTVGGVIDITDLSRTGSLVEGLDRSGAFLTARVRWTTTTIVSGHTFYVLAGGAANSGSLPTNGAQSGFGFKAVGTALKGVTVASGTENVVDLSTTLSSGTFVELTAIRRGSAVLFYVNGVYKSSSSSNLPSSAASSYEVRTQNESSSATNAKLQVTFLTVGIPRS